MKLKGYIGMGAVMGSKNLKAIVVYGTGNVPVNNPETVGGLQKAYASQIITNAENFRKYGTAGKRSDAQSPSPRQDAWGIL